MAAQDDSGFDTSFGNQDPTALFQQLSNQNANQGAMGQIRQGTLGAGMNPQMAQAQQVQNRLKQIIGQANTELDSDPDSKDMDPLDRQIKIAQQVSSGMVGISPQVSMQANQQVLKLTNAKMEQAKLRADTEDTVQQTQSRKNANQAGSVDPMVLVQMDKDSYGLPTAKMYGNPLSIFDQNGQITPQGAQDYQGAMNDAKTAGVQAIPMRASQYTAMLEKMNESRGIAAMARVQQQTQLQLMGVMSPQAIDAKAQQIIDRDDKPLEPPVSSRNPIAIHNYNEIQAAIAAKGVDPATIDASDFPNNTKTYLEFGGHGQTGQAIQSINVAMTHNELMRQWAQALNNTDPMVGAQLINSIKQKWQAMSGQPAPTSFDAAKDFVADENVKGILGGSGRTALGDRETAQEKLLRSATPQSINKVLDNWQDLQSGQLEGIKTRWDSSLQGIPQAKKDERWQSKLGPGAQAHLKATAGGTQQTTTPIVPNTGGARATAITNQADYDKLPSGAYYTFNGQTAQKK
jgi:hypothetical protein